MGTRATVKFYEQFGYEQVCICAVYHQYDGDLAWVGRKLATLLKETTIVDGFTTGMTIDDYANGIGCLSAQYVKTAKDSLGNVYMTSEEDTQEYDYQIYSKPVHGDNADFELDITVTHFSKPLFKGGVDEFCIACGC